MLTTVEVARILQGVTYRPGWTITATDDEHEGQVVTIAGTVASARRPDATVDLDIRTYLPPCDTADELLRWLSWRLRRVESHESREFLRYQGRHVSDPHA